jgi:hypothetical protein
MDGLFCREEWYYYFSMRMVWIVVYSNVKIGGRAYYGIYQACFLILSWEFGLGLEFYFWKGV